MKRRVPFVTNDLELEFLRQGYHCSRLLHTRLPESLTGRRVMGVNERATFWMGQTR